MLSAQWAVPKDPEWEEFLPRLARVLHRSDFDERFRRSLVAPCFADCSWRTPVRTPRASNRRNRQWGVGALAVESGPQARQSRPPPDPGHPLTQSGGRRSTCWSAS